MNDDIRSAPPLRSAASQTALLLRTWFGAFMLVRAATGVSVQIQTVAVGWQIYDISRDPFDLGMVGLSQFLPALLLVFLTGHASDKLPRGLVMGISLAVEAACAALLMVLTVAVPTKVWPLFGVMAAFGTARAFYNPAQIAILPSLVSTADLPRAVSLNGATIKLAATLGPVAGGLLYGISALTAYGSALVLLLVASAVSLVIPRVASPSKSSDTLSRSLVGGFRYVWSQKVVLGAISLDLFAVLLGGATALLPVFARDILVVGPFGLGLLRSASAIGAVPMALLLGLWPIRDHAGAIMIWTVIVFGVATVLFGLSTLPWLSIVMLAVMGAADMVSVNIRQTLIQLWTPNHLRGRVGAINMVCVGASNEMGEFRAGVVASLIGAVPAVVIGGIGTVAVAGLWARIFSDFRRIRRLDVVAVAATPVGTEEL